MPPAIPSLPLFTTFPLREEDSTLPSDKGFPSIDKRQAHGGSGRGWGRGGLFFVPAWPRSELVRKYCVQKQVYVLLRANFLYVEIAVIFSEKESASDLIPFPSSCVSCNQSAWPGSQKAHPAYNGTQGLDGARVFLVMGVSRSGKIFALREWTVSWGRHTANLDKDAEIRKGLTAAMLRKECGRKWTWCPARLFSSLPFLHLEFCLNGRQVTGQTKWAFHKPPFLCVFAPQWWLLPVSLRILPCALLLLSGAWPMQMLWWFKWTGWSLKIANEGSSRREVLEGSGASTFAFKWISGLVLLVKKL